MKGKGRRGNGAGKGIGEFKGKGKLKGQGEIEFQQWGKSRGKGNW